jgi:hypothetical protein
MTLHPKTKPAEVGDQAAGEIGQQRNVSSIPYFSTKFDICNSPEPETYTEFCREALAGFPDAALINELAERAVMRSRRWCWIADAINAMSGTAAMVGTVLP